MTVAVPASRVARAEAAYQRDQKRAEAEAQETSLRYAREHARSERRAERERMAVATQWPSLIQALGWFRREWQGALPRTLHELAVHVQPGDVLGGPAWKPAWADYIARSDGGQREPEPIRDAIRSMVGGPNRYDRLGARFLFALACADFDPVKAGWEMRGVCVCLSHEEHELAPCPAMPLSDEYSPWYAERAIERLRQVVMRRAQRRPGVRISESQAIAEAVA